MNGEVMTTCAPFIKDGSVKVLHATFSNMGKELSVNMA
jgi:hypothetical protein